MLRLVTEERTGQESRKNSRTDDHKSLSLELPRFRVAFEDIGFMHSSRTLQAQRIRVIREEGKTGLFYATSPDLKGLLVAEPTLDALEKAIPDAIRDLYKACGEAVVVTPLRDDGEALRSWVAVPADIAGRALSSQSAA